MYCDAMWQTFDDYCDIETCLTCEDRHTCEDVHPAIVMDRNRIVENLYPSRSAKDEEKEVKRILAERLVEMRALSIARAITIVPA